MSLNNSIWHHVDILKKLLLGQSKPKGYPMVRKSDDLYVNVILKGRFLAARRLKFEFHSDLNFSSNGK